ncbi:MAG: efflux RND transporter periplasmic adaptor subunit [Parvibaculales bacterium]
MLRIPTALTIAKWRVFALLVCAWLLIIPTGPLQAAEIKQARGLVKAQTRAIMASEIAAIVTAVPKRTGDSFKKGDTLVSFDCRIFKSQMAKVAADAKAARARLTNSRDLEKMRSIGKLDVTLAEAEVEKTRAELDIARLNVDRCTIKAPFPGKVVELLVNRHESVDLRRNLIEIVSSETLEVEVIVPGRWLPAIRAGQQVTMLIDETGKRATVTIEAVSGAIDPVSQTTVLRGAIQAADAADLLPGMSGVLTFE